MDTGSEAGMTMFTPPSFRRKPESYIDGALQGRSV